MSNLNLLLMSSGDLVNALRSGSLTVSVYGMGYVGTAIAAVWLRAGARVIGVDVDAEKIKKLDACELRLSDRQVEEELRRLKDRISYTTNGVEASRLSNVKIVTVPVYLGKDKRPIFDSFKASIENIARGLKVGDLVIIESSIPPGTTMDVALPILEKVSGLKVERDYALAYSPERIYVGRAIADIEERYPKIIGGVGPISSRVASTLYGAIARKGTLVLSNPTAAEFEKLAEGAYRDVNIALANELAQLARLLGLDFDEIREAANSQPYSNIHKPGPGVGGSCIPVYPYFLMYAAEKVGFNMRLVQTARSINEYAPAYVAELVKTAASELGVSRPRVAVLGLAFRGNVDDTRLSPSYDIINYLRGVMNIIVHDPYVKYDKTLEEWGIKLTNSIEDALKGANVVVIATDHSDYSELTLSRIIQLTGLSSIAVVDSRHMIKDWRSPPPGVIYLAVGRPTTKT
ncbi:nucleotide sugar dehydrogenase [Caldivirga sp. UBA161]|uniref:nucleotide sugar dehydrogenase n=1 Tax=Caldivirga sp. UBA161 TaxID=1915569 RepID=UPI0025C3ED12|nr:nucleotide sugar dehydrogenase [Caldivirga sp. UBA161]